MKESRRQEKRGYGPSVTSALLAFLHWTEINLAYLAVRLMWIYLHLSRLYHRPFIACCFLIDFWAILTSPRYKSYSERADGAAQYIVKRDTSAWPLSIATVV